MTMTKYQLYQFGRVLVCQIFATSHEDAASQFFQANKNINFVSVGRVGTAPEKTFSRN